MAFSVEDFQDLLELLTRHPEWRAELRRHILSEELLELPDVVRQIAEQLAALSAGLDQLTARLDQLTARLDQLTAGLDQLSGEVERLVEAQGRTETRVGRVEGEVLESRYARRAPAYFSPLARRLRVVDSGGLADLLDHAVDEGRLQEAERAAVLEADLVLAGRRREDDVEVYLLAEVSVGVGPHDVERAAERAAMLQKLGRPVMPLVVGLQVPPRRRCLPASAASGSSWTAA